MPNHTCDICGKSFSRKGNLERHMQTHTGVKRFACTWKGCKKRFCDKSNLNGHISTVHEKKRALPCHYPLCNFAAGNTSGLERHMRSHTGAKPFVCIWEGCNQRFTRNEGLTKHINTVHKNVVHKPFPCPQCDKSFTYKRSLDHHRKTLHSSSPSSTQPEAMSIDTSSINEPPSSEADEAMRAGEQTPLFSPLFPFSLDVGDKAMPEGVQTPLSPSLPPLFSLDVGDEVMPEGVQTPLSPSLPPLFSLDVGDEVMPEGVQTPLFSPLFPFSLDVGDKAMPEGVQTPLFSPLFPFSLDVGDKAMPIAASSSLSSSSSSINEPPSSEADEAMREGVQTPLFSPLYPFSLDVRDDDISALSLPEARQEGGVFPWDSVENWDDYREAQPPQDNYLDDCVPKPTTR